MTLFDFFFAPPQAGYRPGWPEWLRWVGWNIRNPLPGFSKGWQNKKYLTFVYYCAPWATLLSKPHFFAPEDRGRVPTWNPEGGWLFARLAESGGHGRRHWISCRGLPINLPFIHGILGIEFYFGTKPSTGTGPVVAFRKANSKGF